MVWSTVYLVIAIIAAIIGIWNLARQRSIFLSLSGILWFLVVLFRWIVPTAKVYDYRIAEGLPVVGDLVLYVVIPIFLILAFLTTYSSRR
jgi:hypothetical protein